MGVFDDLDGRRDDQPVLDEICQCGSHAIESVGADALAGRAEWVTFLAGAGSILLTFLAGAKLDPTVLRRKLYSAIIGSA